MRELTAALVVVALGCAVEGCKAARTEPQTVPDAAAQDGAPEARAPATAGAVDAMPVPADEAMPDPSSDELSARARHLLEAIGKDDADLAADILFPRDGWLATRDASDPGSDWEKHVNRPFRRALHAQVRHHGDLERAQFVSFDLGRVMTQEAIRHHGWKKPLWTVHGSRLTYLVDGHTRTLTIREMTAWRGAWYVTRLR